MNVQRLLHRFGTELGIRFASGIFDRVDRAAGEEEDVFTQSPALGVL